LKRSSSITLGSTRVPFLTSICTSIAGRTTGELVRKAREAFAQGTDLVEFRLDFLRPLVVDDVKSQLRPFARSSVFTIRPPAEGGRFEGEEAERVGLIRKLAQMSPAFFDIELGTIETNPGLLPAGLVTIVSWHDLTKTPSRDRLRSVAARADAFGGLTKVVAAAQKLTDNLEMLSLYDGRRLPPIAFCMGELGLLSRIMAIDRGTPLAYAALDREWTAAGQLPVSQLIALRRRLGDG
jgi:3-dehydroquinate dehydratase type I